MSVCAVACQVGWSEDRYRSVMNPLHGFIIGPEAGFKSSNVQYLPLSAFEGTNIVDNNCAGQSVSE